MLRLLAPTGWLPPPLLAAAELLPALPRPDAAEVRCRWVRVFFYGFTWQSSTGHGNGYDAKP